MKKVIIFTIVCLPFFSIFCQKIELKEVSISCNEIIQEDTIFYEPYAISFIFYAINRSQNNLLIGAYNFPYQTESIKFGYFEFKPDKMRKIKLKSRFESICVLTNDSLRILTEIQDEKALIISKHYSPSEIYDYVVNGRFFFNCIKKDYNVGRVRDNCQVLFKSQEILKKEFLIIFSCNGKIIHYYPVNINSSKSTNINTGKGS